MSAFWTRRDATPRLLDLGYRPAKLARMSTNPTLRIYTWFNEFLVAHAVCWPLFASSSIRVRHSGPECAFRPEYIIPQLILQWLTQEQAFDGLRYASTRVLAEPYDSRSPHWICNYVFPVRTASPEGYCSRLREIFDWTDPISWQLAESILLPPGIDESCVDRFELEISRGRHIQYHASTFGRQQSFLNELVRRRKLEESETSS